MEKVTTVEETEADYTLEPTTRELILKKLDEIKANIQTKEQWFPTRDERHKQMEAIEIDLLYGTKKRLETMLINNHFEEINI